MGLLTSTQQCAQCDTELDEDDDIVERENKLFCSEEHADQFQDEHGKGDHNTEDDREVCRFC